MFDVKGKNERANTDTLASLETGISGWHTEV